MKHKLVVGVAALFALQATLVLAYLVVERTRGRNDSAAFDYEPVTDPKLTPIAMLELLEQPDGTRVSPSTYDQRPLLLHFWATWCKPCTAELPTLLAAIDAEQAADSPALLLVSVDENWDTIRHYFKGKPPPNVVRDPQSSMSRRLAIVNLPETLLIDESGSAVARVRGARNWQSREAREAVAKLLGAE